MTSSIRQKIDQTNKTELKPKNNKDIQCGIGSCRPRWLQKLANKYVFLLFFAFMEIMQATFYSYFRSVISTLERQFAVQSQTIGLVLSGKEISQILCGLVLAYYGGRGNRPRWIACGMVIISFACLVMVSPIFLYLGDPALQLIHKPESGIQKQMCSFTNGSAINLWTNASYNGSISGHDCDAISMDTVSALVLLFVGGFIAGTGIIMLVTLAYPYLDDSSTKSSSALYIAIVTGLQVTGPTVGSILGGLCLKFYVTLSSNPGITEDDPKWIGAWWLGFVIIGIAFLLGSMIIVFFPRQLNHDKKDETQTQEIVLTSDKDIANNNIRKSPKIRGLLSAIKRLLKNKILICHAAARCFILFGTNGHETFQPKYIESYFHQTASDSSFFTGISGNAMRIVGILILGVVLRFWKPKAIYVTAWNIILDFIYIGSLIALMLINCPTLEIIGFNSNLANNIQLNEQTACTANCTGNCANVKFTPICLENKNYFSPCHAGCTQYEGNKRKDRIYRNCSCASNKYDWSTVTPIFNDTQLASLNFKYAINNESTRYELPVAKTGYCPFSCSSFTIYLIVMGIMRTLMATRKVSRMLIILRCIDEKDKSLGIAIHTLMESIFAYIPCPIIYGALMDAACIMWGNNCGQRGNCWLYDSDYLRYVMQGLTLLVITCGTALDGYVLYLCRALNLFEEDKPQAEAIVEIPVPQINNKSHANEMEITEC